MTLRQLQYLVAVAELGSFTRAAESLHVSQPSLSQQIQALEAEVGGPLLDRPPKPVAPTAAGRAFLSEARVTVASAERAMAVARRTMRLVPETIEVATVRSLAVSMFPDCLQRWQEQMPGVAIRLHEHPHRRAVVEAVRERRAELGVGPAPGNWHGAFKRLGWDQLVVVLPAEDALLRTSGPLPLEAMRHHEWVLFDESHGLAENVNMACAAAGFEPRPVLRTAQVEAAARLAAAGLGPTLVPRKNVPRELESCVRTLDPPVVWELAAFADERRFSPTASAFVDALEEGEWWRRMPHGARVLTLAEGG